MDDKPELEIITVEHVNNLPLHLPGRLYTGLTPEAAAQDYTRRTGLPCRAYRYTGSLLGGRPWVVVFCTIGGGSERQ